MERLTRREYGIAHYPYCFKEETCDGLGTSSKCDDCNFSTAVCEKLAHYEDLEEQGLLLKLPCKVGDTVWTLKFPEITKEDGSVWTVCDRKKQTVVPVKFTLFILNDIGVYYFLTKEEAEAKLKELENESK